jgi:hypothetical protein
MARTAQQLLEQCVIICTLYDLRRGPEPDLSAITDGANLQTGVALLNLSGPDQTLMAAFCRCGATRKCWLSLNLRNWVVGDLCSIFQGRTGEPRLTQVQRAYSCVKIVVFSLM